MILVIDNYDSFVYNLARYFEILGFATKIIRNDAISLEEIRTLKPSHIVISPGPRTPNEAGISCAIIAEFYQDIPILGVCLGHQAIGQVFGAKITHAIKPMHGVASMIVHDETGIFQNIPNPFLVGRYHSLIVADILSDSELKVTATSKEGEIMALQHKIYPLYGVQFHPEAILTQHGLALITNFVNI